MATKTISSSKVKKYAAVSGAVGIPLIILAFFYMSSLGYITITGYSGDMKCMGTTLEPCIAEINFTANQNISLTKTSESLWMLNTTKPLKDIKMYVNGKYINISKASYKFLSGQNYTVRFVALKYNITDTIKWSFGEVDPVWEGYKKEDFFVTLIDSYNDLTYGIGIYNLTNPTNQKLQLKLDAYFIPPAGVTYDHYVYECSMKDVYVTDYKYKHGQCEGSKNNQTYYYDCEIPEPYQKKVKVESCDWFSIPNNILDIGKKETKTVKLFASWKAKRNMAPMDWVPEIGFDINDSGNVTKYKFKQEEWAWWNTSFSYKKQIKIQDNAGANTNFYPARINVTYEAGMQSDFDDLRFVNSTENGQLDYFVDYNASGLWAIVWVEVNLSSSANTTIYMYYGSSIATTQSNGTKTFFRFDGYDTDYNPPDDNTYNNIPPLNISQIRSRDAAAADYCRVQNSSAYIWDKGQADFGYCHYRTTIATENISFYSNDTILKIKEFNWSMYGGDAVNFIVCGFIGGDNNYTIISNNFTGSGYLENITLVYEYNNTDLYNFKFYNGTYYTKGVNITNQSQTIYALTQVQEYYGGYWGKMQIDWFAVIPHISAYPTAYFGGIGAQPNITSPLNDTYNTNIIDFNYTHNVSGVSWCAYSVNNTANQTDIFKGTGAYNRNISINISGIDLPGQIGYNSTHLFYLPYNETKVYYYWKNFTYTGYNFNFNPNLTYTRNYGIGTDGINIYISTKSNATLSIAVYNYTMNGTYNGGVRVSFPVTSMTWDGTYWWLTNGWTIYKYYQNWTATGLNFSTNGTCDITAGSGQQILYAIADTYIDRYYPSTNYGTATNMLLNRNSNNPALDFEKFILLRFNLNELSAGVNITKSNLTLYKMDWGEGGVLGEYYSLCEGNFTWYESNWTWELNEQSHGTRDCNYEQFWLYGPANASLYINATTLTINDYENHYGFNGNSSIYLWGGGSGISFNYASISSKEDNNITKKPKLIINYSYNYSDSITGLWNDGTYLYYVNRCTNQTYKYSLTGTYQSNWTIKNMTSDPRGLYGNSTWFWINDPAAEVAREYYNTAQCMNKSSLTFVNGSNNITLWINDSDNSMVSDTEYFTINLLNLSVMRYNCSAWDFGLENISWNLTAQTQWNATPICQTNYTSIMKASNMGVTSNIDVNASVSTSYSGTTKDRSTVGLWHLDGNAKDATGRNNGTATGVSAQSGHINGYYTFDGTDDEISVAHSASLNLSRNFTMAAWVYTNDSVAGNEGIINKIDSGLLRYALRTTTGYKGYCDIYNGTTIRVTGTSSLNDSVWHQVACRNNGTYLSILVDGVVENATPHTLSYLTTDGILYFGRNVPDAGPSNYWNGSLDEIQIWNRSLTDAELLSNYNSQYSRVPNCISIYLANSSDAEGYWDLDEGSGSVAIDKTMNHNGTITGALNASGKYNYARALNGSTDYIRIGTAQNFSDVCVNGCTVCAWINSNQHHQYDILARWDETDNNRFFHLGVQLDDDLYYAVGYNGNLSVCVIRDPEIHPQINTWEFVCGWYNTTHISTYLNGISVENGTCAFTGINLTAWRDNESTFLGVADDGSPINYFNGTVDDVRVWKRALSANEIIALNNSVSAYKITPDITRAKSITINPQRMLLNLSVDRTELLWNWIDVNNCSAGLVYDFKFNFTAGLPS